MRRGRFSAGLLTVVCLHACGGDDGGNPMAPTGDGGPATPITVTVTAQVASNTALQGVRAFGQQGPPTESRNLRVTGRVDVTGGSFTGEANLAFTFTPDGNQPPVTQMADIFGTRIINPNQPVDFLLDVPLELPAGTSTAGDVVVNVTGTDANGGTVNVFSPTVPVFDSSTVLPPGNCAPDGTTLCVLSDRFEVTAVWEDFVGNAGPAMVTDGQRFEDGGWLFFSASSGILNPDGFDLFVQMQNNCGNTNHYWVFAAAATDVEFTLRVTDTATNQTRTYFNPLGTAAQAITDTQAFATCP